MTVIAASTRTGIADFVSALVLVYSLIVILYVLTSMIFSFGARVPYARWSDALLSFLRDVSEPYLSIFRRFIPMIGPLDITPIVALLVLNIVGGVVANAIHG